MNERGKYLKIFIKNLTECTTLVQDVNNGGSDACMGSGICGKCLYLSLNFALNLKLL